MAKHSAAVSVSQTSLVHVPRASNARMCNASVYGAAFAAQRLSSFETPIIRHNVYPTLTLSGLASHFDCSSGLFCIDGYCTPDREPGGCDTCTVCAVDADCADGSTCVDTPRGKRCLTPCEPRADSPCRGDMRCANMPGPPSFHCVNPDFDRKGVCPGPGVVNSKVVVLATTDCDDGVACEDRQCQSSDEPVEDMNIDSSVEPEDAGPLPDDASEADALDIEVKTNRRSGGCSHLPDNDTPSWFWLTALA